MNQLKKELKSIIVEKDFSGAVYMPKQELLMCQGDFDKANGLKINKNTRFGIASGTKLFTALGIMLLEEKGLLSINDLVFDSLEKPCEMYSSEVTIKQLLSHTSGIPDYFDEEEITDFDNFQSDIPWNKLEKPSDYFKVLPKKKMKFTPGTNFKYNNSAFILLAIIIEKITGSYYQFMEEEVLNKANMNRSGFFAFNQLPSNTAYGYIKLDEGYRTNVYDLPIRGGGDGGMYTTVIDMAIFWEALMNGDIVKKETYNKMIKPVHLSNELSYGLGVWLKKKEESYYPLIIGEDAGVSFESGLLESNSIYVVCSNTQDGVWPISRIINK